MRTEYKYLKLDDFFSAYAELSSHWVRFVYMTKNIIFRMSMLKAILGHFFIQIKKKTQQGPHFFISPFLCPTYVFTNGIAAGWLACRES